MAFPIHIDDDWIPGLFDFTPCHFSASFVVWQISFDIGALGFTSG
jgi:hypothetical protein